MLFFFYRNNALKNNFETKKINENDESLSLFTTAMNSASKVKEIKNINSISNNQINLTKNTIENWLKNNNHTKNLNQNLLSSTNLLNNNWSQSWLNDSSFKAAIAASINELYGNESTPQLLFHQQQHQQLLCNQQHMLSNVAGTSIQQQQQSFKGKKN